MTERPAPRATATYRLQLHAGFDFAAAAALADYLAELGVSHLYASPYLKAVRGSTHGYDVVDPTRVNPELGGEDGHARLLRALAEHGLLQILDVVPNHLAAARENAWWWEVLESGVSSVRAPFFDIDWDAPEARYKGVILLPVLADHYGRVLERGELRLVRAGGSVEVRYREQAWPLSPESLGPLLEDVAVTVGSEALATMAAGLRELPVSTDTQLRGRRARQLGSLQRTLERTLDEEPAAASAVDAALERINADADALDRVLETQHYRLAYWRAGTRDLDYRRFFDVDTLVGVRVEDPEVFAATQARVLWWLGHGALDGVRIDHPDGLRRPREYLERLRAGAPDAWIVVEKILAPGEALRDDWPVDGTTGYDFIGAVGGLFVDPAGEAPLTELYHEVTGETLDWPALVYARRVEVVREVLWSDLSRLTHWAVRVLESRRRYRDFTSWEIREALAEVLACFPVYRSYVREDGTASDEDRELIGEAVADARQRRADLESELFDLIEAVLAGGADGPAERELRMRFQQLTGPTMAKAVEDTAFYAYGRFLALNEVGGAPDRFGVSPAAFHEHCARAAARWPRTLLALSTHDTKRSEDVRARLAVLSEMPAGWAEAVRRWTAHNARHRRGELPDRATEYFFYQTLVGAWPLPADRAAEYMRKAVREAKTRTSWTAPVADYEAALESFVRGVLEDPVFAADLEAFLGPLVAAGRINSLAQKLVQLTAPGAPDLYQGTELWDLSLVDPDNRRPVDWQLRRGLLGELARAERDGGPAGGARAALARASEGGPKLWVVRQALRVRCRRPAALGPGGTYLPLEPRGAAAEHALAFARGDEVVTVVPRLVLGLARRGGWGDTELELPPGQWRDALTGEPATGRVRVGSLLGGLPVALLERVA